MGKKENHDQVKPSWEQEKEKLDTEIMEFCEAQSAKEGKSAEWYVEDLLARMKEIYTRPTEEDLFDCLLQEYLGSLVEKVMKETVVGMSQEEVDALNDEMVRFVAKESWELLMHQQACGYIKLPEPDDTLAAEDEAHLRFVTGRLDSSHPLRPKIERAQRFLPVRF